MLILLWVMVFVYCVVGAIFGATIGIREEWPHSTNWTKTIVAFILFGPIFWFLFILFNIFLGISGWLAKK